MKVNLGCGRRAMAGWVNVDAVPLPGVDVVADLDDPVKVVLPWADDSVDKFAMIHVLEHIRHPLPLLQELWRCATADATLTIACPYGSSDDADEDPTHVRRMFVHSFDYFGQPFYYRASYGYEGDWRVEHLTVDLPDRYRNVSNEDVMADLMALRNVAVQITAVLHAVKPARPPRQDLIELPKLRFRVPP